MMISTIFLEVSAWYIDHIWEILLALMAFLKVIGNLIPSEKPREVFAILDKIVNALVPDRVKE